MTISCHIFSHMYFRWPTNKTPLFSVRIKHYGKWLEAVCLEDPTGLQWIFHVCSANLPDWVNIVHLHQSRLSLSWILSLVASEEFTGYGLHTKWSKMEHHTISPKTFQKVHPGFGESDLSLLIYRI